MSFISKIKNKFTDKSDKNSIVPESEMMFYDAVNMDLNNICNQRCRFCFSPFKDEPVNMDVDTFKRTIEILPLLKNLSDGGHGFFISCLYEPTVNPNFLELLSLLPESAKDKSFFTTNLARPMDREYIEAMLSANVNHINISIETLNQDSFKYITQNKKFNQYKNNLDLLEDILSKKEGNVPYLRFITMLLEENSDEIIDLIEYCHNHFNLLAHEIRTPYMAVYDNYEWSKKQLMPKEKVDKIISEIKSLDYNILMDIKSADDLILFESDELKSNPEKPAVLVNDDLEPVENNIYEEAKKRFSVVEDPEYLFLRINADGTCVDKINNVLVSISKDNPRKFFEDMIYELYLSRAKASHCENYAEDNVTNGDAFIFIDKFSKNDAYIEFSGWCCPDRKVNINKLIIKLTGNNGDVHYYHASTKERPDADEFKSKNEGWCGGFTTYIENNGLKDDIYSIELLYNTYDDETICYDWEYLMSIKDA